MGVISVIPYFSNLLIDVSPSLFLYFYLESQWPSIHPISQTFLLSYISSFLEITQKQTFTGAFRKSCSEDMQKNLREITHVSNCDFNKVALQLY